MADRYSSHFAGLDAPYVDGFAVTPSDTVDLAEVSRALIFTGAGNLRVTTLGGTVMNFTAPAPGVPFRIRAARVHATGTTVTSINALV